MIIKAQNIVLSWVKIIAEEVEVKIKSDGLFYKTNLFSLPNASISINGCMNIIHDDFSSKEDINNFLKDKFIIANLKDMQHPDLQPANLIGLIEDNPNFEF